MTGYDDATDETTEHRGGETGEHGDDRAAQHQDAESGQHRGDKSGQDQDEESEQRPDGGERTKGNDDGERPHADDDAELTHVDETGDVQMVDVGSKPDSKRRAVASGTIHLSASTIGAIRDDAVDKGDVLATARIGAVQAVKHTWETIPMCHQIPITNVDTDFDVREDRVTLTVTVETTGKTGCEMEALEGVTTGLNVVWDMVKAAEKDDAGQYPGTRIDGVEVLTKEKRRVEESD